MIWFSIDCLFSKWKIIARPFVWLQIIIEVISLLSIFFTGIMARKELLAVFFCTIALAHWGWPYQLVKSCTKSFSEICSLKLSVTSFKMGSALGGRAKKLSVLEFMNECCWSSSFLQEKNKKNEEMRNRNNFTLMGGG